MIADGQGRAISFTLAPGQAHEPPLATGLLDFLPEAPLWVIGGRGPRLARVPPPHPEHRRAACDPVEAQRGASRLSGSRLKEWRAVAMRYEKTARSFMGVLWSAAAIDWAKS